MTITDSPLKLHHMPTNRLRRSTVAATLVLAAVLSAASAELAAQGSVNAALRWQTITTPHFRIHYEPGLEAWSKSLAERIEQMREIVAQRVGYAPNAIVDIIVEDPVNQPNGSAWPSLPVPSMRFWATPPDPGSVIGHLTDWGGLLGIHEFAHIAHLTRPSRNTRTNLLWKLSPVPLGPVAFKSPAWVTEGYATLIEGELTGSGRPNGVARPSIIRQLALEGALPSYGMLDNAGPFLGGTMRYLVGSAYLEWLQAQRGDSALVHLWRRMSAKQDRTFDAAFAGVFGDTPWVLYGRFVAEVTAQAVAAKQALATQGLAQGGLRQHQNWYVGAPALSLDGEKIAVRLSAPGQPTRVVVMETKPVNADSNLIRARMQLLKRDSLDVLPIDVYPFPLKRLATLMPVAGVGFDAPRWIPGTDHLLVVRSSPLSDGRARADIYRWDTKTGAVERVTERAGIREVDPLPDGKSAAAVTCGAGTCGLVRVDLASGALRTLYAGTVEHPLAGARVSPDGKRVATSIARAGSWRAAVVDIASGTLTDVGPRDGHSRWAPTWEGDTALIVVSDASGAANIERIALSGDLANSTRQITRVTGAATSPDRAPDGRVWFLDLHARGFDLRAIAPDSIAPLATTRALVASMGAVAPRRDTTKVVPLVPRTAAAPRGYGVGALAVRPFYWTNNSTEGSLGGLALQLGDPLGRLSVLARGGAARGGLMQGANLGVAWRGTRPAILASAFAVEQRPSEQWRLGGLGVSAFDVRYTGGVIGAELLRSTMHGGSRAALQWSTGRLDRPAGLIGVADGDRQLAAFVVGSSYVWTPGGSMRLRNSFDVNYSRGTTLGDDWQRVVGHLVYGVTGIGGDGLQIEATAGWVDDDAPVFERFTVGGAAPGLVDESLLSQRIIRPGLPFAVVGGSKVLTARASTTGALRLFHEWYGVGSYDLAAANRAAGIVGDFAIPSVAALRVPNGKISAGALYSFDGPFAKKWGGHFSLTISP